MCAERVTELPALCRLVAQLGASLWSVFFLVPVGRGRTLAPLSAAETEDVLAFLHDVAAFVPVKTTEAPAFRRFALLAEGGEPPPGRGALYDEPSILFSGLARIVGRLPDLAALARPSLARRLPAIARAARARRWEEVTALFGAALPPPARARVGAALWLPALRFYARRQLTAWTRQERSRDHLALLGSMSGGGRRIAMLTVRATRRDLRPYPDGGARGKSSAISSSFARSRA